MPPRLRTLLILAFVAVAGVTALAFLAQKYRGMVPEPTAIAPEVGAEPSPAVPREEPPTETQGHEASPPVAAPVPSPEDRAAVESFLAVRTAIRSFVETRPRAAKTVARALSEGESAAVPVDSQFLAMFRGTRGAALLEAGMEAESYRTVREAFAAWEKGEASGPLAAAFDERADDARKAALGDLEALDYKLSF